jgi:hypothetical protein
MVQANQQNATIKFGSNRFVCEADFTIIGLNDTGGVVIGATLPPTTQAVWIEFRQGGAFLNADISDADGELVAKVRNNVIEFNKENVYLVETHPENQIPPERVVITNSYGETAIDLSLKEGVWEFTGDFFSQGQHIVATAEGLTLNPQTPQV